MVRHYKAKNKYAPGSKLSEKQVELILTGYLSGYTPEQMTESIGVSSRSINQLCAKFRARILTSRALLKELLRDGVDFWSDQRFVDTLDVATEEFWDSLWFCIRQCPNKIQIYPGTLNEYFDFIYRILVLQHDVVDHEIPRQPFKPHDTGKFSFYFRHRYCSPRCSAKLHLPLDALTLSLLGTAVQRKRINREMFPLHFVPLYIEMRMDKHSYVLARGETMGADISPLDFHALWMRIHALLSYELMDRLMPVIETELL